MNKLFKIFLFTLIMSFNMVSFAQSPGDDTDSGDLEDVDDAPASPIDENLLWLTVSGIAIACYSYIQKEGNKIENK